MTARRLAVVGADAAGMSAAHQALRTARARGEELEVVAVEMTDDTSYSACGIPYLLADDVDSADDLVARTASVHREMGVDLRLRQEAVGLDLGAQRLTVRDHATGRTYDLGFDDVLIATGAAPNVPDWARGVPGVLPVKTMDDARAWRRLLAADPRSALVVGGGFIGVEIAETFVRRGISTTMVTRGAEPMSSTLAPDLAVLVRKVLEDLGVRVITSAEVTGIDCAGTGSPVHVLCLNGTELHADVTALGIGVRARVELATDAGLAVGEHGGLVPDDRQRLREGVWAAGDCCEVYDRTLKSHRFVPLGTHANKAGRVAGTNIGGADSRFPGVVGTSITRVGAAEVARTGISPSAIPRLGLADDDLLTITMESSTAAGYMPEADPITVFAMADRRTGRLLAFQIVGGRGAGKRIDTAATAIWAGLDVGQVAMLDLAYAPPFSPVWDPVQIACRKLADHV